MREFLITALILIGSTAYYFYEMYTRWSTGPSFYALGALMLVATSSVCLVMEAIFS